MGQEFDKYIQFIPLIIIGFAFAALLTPIVMKLAIRFGVADKPKSQIDPNMRGADTISHDKVMPRMGFIAVLLPIFVITPFFVQLTFQIYAFFGCLIVLSIFGIIDDKYRLQVAPQFLMQIICILIVIFSGITIQEANNPFTGSFINFERGYFLIKIFDTQISFTILSIFVTFVWMMVITNSVAWIDGVDGALNGSMAIATLIILLVSIRENSLTSAVISAIFLGANLGFLPYNFNPARIINGFGGEIYGFMISVLAILGQVKLSIAVLALLVPIVDVIWVIGYRIRKYKPTGFKSFIKAITTPGKVHLAHRLINTGLNTRRAVLIEYILIASVGLLAILLSGLEITFLILSSAIIVLLIFIFLDKMIKERNKKT